MHPPAAGTTSFTHVSCSGLGWPRGDGEGCSRLADRSCDLWLPRKVGAACRCALRPSGQGRWPLLSPAPRRHAPVMAGGGACLRAGAVYGVRRVPGPTGGADEVGPGQPGAWHRGGMLAVPACSSRSSTRPSAAPGAPPSAHNPPPFILCCPRLPRRCAGPPACCWWPQTAPPPRPR